MATLGIKGLISRSLDRSLRRLEATWFRDG